ncbi:MAG: EAL domain-containing protein [Rhodospirillales bacterium]
MVSPGQRLLAISGGEPADRASAAATALGPLESTLALMTDAVMVTTPELDPPGPRVIYVNDAFTRLTGYAAAEVAGKVLRLAHGVEPAHEALDRLRRDLERDRRARGSAVRYRKDGTDYVVDWQMVPLHDRRGDVRHWMIIYRDANADRRAECDHAAVEHSLRLLVDNQPDPICRFLPDTTLTFFNRAYADLFRAPPEELTGRRFIELMAERDRPALIGHLRAIVADRPSAQYEHRFAAVGGGPRWLLWNTLGYFDETGAVLSYQAVGTDITDRKLAEEELRKLSGAVEHSPSAIIVADAHGRIEYVNPAFTAVSGYTADEVIGQRPNILKSDTTSEVLYRELWQTITGGGVWRGELRNRKKTGEPYWDLVAIAPIRDGSGAITHFVAIQHEITEQKLLQEQMAHDATHDSLTDLVNRREFERRLGHAVDSAKRQGSIHVLCYLDLDQFKIVNDTAGHAAGDELLKQIRGLLKGKFRGRDTLARLGGDEFGLLLDNCTLDRALKITEMVIANLRDYRFTWDGRTFRVGVSIGLAAITAETKDAAQAMSQADVACYAAKERGRNRVRVYHGEGAEPAEDHSEMRRAATLREAIEQNRFCLYCQPIIALHPHAAAEHRYEILVRMIDPDGQLVLPGAFIPAAERYGLMAEIDRWVIRHALRQCKKLFRSNPRLDISINLSGNSLNDERFPDFLKKQLTRTRVPTEQICFEITETAAIRNIAHATQMITDIRSRGSRFALDDFGSGLSSFSYLKTLPVDYVKIDGRFVRDMVGDSIDRAMVAAINQVGHVMGIRTIAEYAHDRATLEQLAALGVDYAQGYAVGAPVPLASIHDELRPTRH